MARNGEDRSQPETARRTADHPEAGEVVPGMEHAGHGQVAVEGKVVNGPVRYRREETFAVGGQRTILDEIIARPALFFVCAAFTAVIIALLGIAR